jgi:hypothetical protein
MHLRLLSFSSLRIPRSAFIIYHLAFIACLLLSSCTVPPTPYQSISRDGGYTQSRTGTDSYAVGFTGNPETVYTRAYDFAILRACEIGQQLGYSWFVVEGQSDNSSRQVLNGPSTSQTFGTAVGPGLFVGTTTTFPNQTTEFRPGVQLSITYYHDKPAGTFLANTVFNITDTLASLRAKYNLSPNLTPLPPPGNTTMQG